MEVHKILFFHKSPGYYPYFNLIVQ
jgi:hypothetical protein